MVYLICRKYPAHPPLLRMGPQQVNVPGGTVLVLTLRFAKSFSYRGVWFEVCLGRKLLFPLERSTVVEKIRETGTTLYRKH
jgi:hypothetical protein